jgi:predicted dehydrogenase
VIKNIAVVGCGQWGKNLIRNFYELGVLHSICDQNNTTSTKYSKLYNIQILSFNEILNDSNIKGVVLTVPAQSHSQMAIDVMSSGKHVLVEKPFAMNEDEAKLMILTAKKNKVQIMVGHLLQYHPIFNTMKKIIDRGEIGELKYIYSNRLSFGRVRTEEDIIWSFAPHDISMILSLAGQQPEFIIANSSCLLQQNHADIANIHMEFKSGLKSHISVSWLNPFKEVKLVVLGKSAKLVFDDIKPWNRKLSIFKYEKKFTNGELEINQTHSSYLEIPEAEPLKIECQHFIDVVEKNINPITDGVEGLQVIKVLSAASKSQNKKKLVKL